MSLRRCEGCMSCSRHASFVHLPCWGLNGGDGPAHQGVRQKDAARASATVTDFFWTETRTTIEGEEFHHSRTQSRTLAPQVASRTGPMLRIAGALRCVRARIVGWVERSETDRDFRCSQHDGFRKGSTILLSRVLARHCPTPAIIFSTVWSRSQQNHAPPPTNGEHGRKQGNGGTREAAEAINSYGLFQAARVKNPAAFFLIARGTGTWIAQARRRLARLASIVSRTHRATSDPRVRPRAAVPLRARSPVRGRLAGRPAPRDHTHARAPGRAASCDGAFASGPQQSFGSAVPWFRP